MSKKKRSVVLYEGDRVVLATSAPEVIAAVVAALGLRLDGWATPKPGQDDDANGGGVQ